MYATRRFLLALFSLAILGATAACSAADEITGPSPTKAEFVGYIGSGG